MGYSLVMEVGEHITRRSFDVKEDFKLSWSLFKENFRPFFIVLLIGFIIYKSLDHYLTKIVLPSIQWENVSIDPGLMLFLIFLPGDSIYFGFFGAAMGLGYDIMSSGDGFTEIRNSLYYIRKYWLKFFLFCFFFNIFSFWLLYMSYLPIPLFTSITFHLLNFIWVLFFSNVFPALVHRNSFSCAIKENFEILSRRFSRVILTYLPYYFVFSYIRTGLVIFRNYLYMSVALFTSIRIVILLFELLYFFIGFPLFAFLSSIMYNDEIRSQELTN